MSDLTGRERRKLEKLLKWATGASSTSLTVPLAIFSTIIELISMLNVTEFELPPIACTGRLRDVLEDMSDAELVAGRDR